MKKLLLLFTVLAFVPNVQAQIETLEAPMARFAPPEAVEISSGAFSMATSSTTRFRGMNVVLIDNPSTNTATMVGHMGTCSGTSVPTSITGPLEIAPGSNGGFISVGEKLCIWLMSLSTAGGETVHIQGISQKR